MDRRHFLRLLGAVAGGAVLSACGRESRPGAEATPLVPAENPQLPPRGYFMGLLPSPARGQTFDQAYASAASLADFVPIWGRPTPYYNLATDLRGDWGETFLTRLVRGNGMFPIVHLSFIAPGPSLTAPPSLASPTLEDPAWRATYKQAAIDVVKAARPRYLSIGNEVNRWYEQFGDEGPNGFAHYLGLHHEIYDAVKELSPSTLVFCTFAREIVAANREANLDVLRRFDARSLDLLVLTSYPYALGKRDPSLIPDDYFSRLLDLLPGKRLAFSEIAWPSLDALGGEQAQAEFLHHAVSRLTRDQGVELHLLGWPWLHDLDENDAIGLARPDGSEKLALATWRSLAAAA